MHARPGQLLLHRKLGSPGDQVMAGATVLFALGSTFANRAELGVPGLFLTASSSRSSPSGLPSGC